MNFVRVNLNYPKAYEEDTPIRRWVEHQRLLGRTGWMDYPSKDILKGFESVDRIRAHLNAIDSRAREVANRAIAPALEIVQVNTTDWMAKGTGTRGKDFYYIHKDKTRKEKPFELTVEDKDGQIVLLENHDTLGKAVIHAIRTNRYRTSKDEWMTKDRPPTVTPMVQVETKEPVSEDGEQNELFVG